MAGLLRQLLEILRLRSAVPFAERMDVVDIADDDPGLAGKFARGQALEKSGAGQPAMHIRHPGRDVLAELKLVSALEDFDGAKFAGPVVDILEQMTVDGAKVS